MNAPESEIGNREPAIRLRRGSPTKRGTAWLSWRGLRATLLVALALVFVGGCSSGGKGTGAEAEFDSELFAVAKKAKNRKEFKQAIQNKIKERQGFVTKESSGKAKKKFR